MPNSYKRFHNNHNLKKDDKSRWKTMSLPNIPDISPNITITQEDVVNLLLASIALEELGLAHIINAEGEKIQFAFELDPPPTLDDLLEINSSVQRTLDMVIKNEILLSSKLREIVDTLIP